MLFDTIMQSAKETLRYQGDFIKREAVEAFRNNAPKVEWSAMLARLESLFLTFRAFSIA